MAKAHKLAGTGLGLDTALSVADLQSICLAAAPQATGTLWKGTERVTLVSQTDKTLVFEMAALIKSIKRMIFTVSFSERDGRRQVLTTINHYLTTRWMLWGIIPMGPREMVAHYVYVEFLELVAKTVRDADPTAAARLELGPYQKASIPSSSLGVATPVAASSPAIAPEQKLLAPQQPAAPIPQPLASEEPAVVPTRTPEPELQVQPEIDSTMLVDRRPRQVHWSLTTEAGATIEVLGRVVLGREPQTVYDGDSAVVVGAEDPSVSSSHAIVEVRESRLIVTDLGSTNGTVVLTSDGREIVCAPGVAVDVADGSAIELGAYTLMAGTHMRRAR